jgi:hypothetical protein
VHHQVLRDLAPELGALETLPAGHPVTLMRRENRAIREAVEDLRCAQEPVLRGEAFDVEAWRAALDRVLEVDKHYARKENLLFPKLEAHGIGAPSQVMWAKDDEVRELARALREALTDDPGDAEAWRFVAQTVGVPLADQAEAMVDREEKILIPMALEKLSETDWANISRETSRFGICLVEPGPTWEPAARLPAAGEAPAPELPDLGPGARVSVGVGSATLDQLRAILGVLPVDLTFVDAEDRVAFFSEGDRIFQRTPSVIGRKVHLCHPPKSVATVERIVDDFKSGERDVAEFWIQLHGRFVHIRYFAVRDEDERYLGTLEVTQDLTRLRALDGERRLLTYDEPSETSEPGEAQA